MLLLSVLLTNLCLGPKLIQLGVANAPSGRCHGKVQQQFESDLERF